MRGAVCQKGVLDGEKKGDETKVVVRPQGMHRQ
jgi:hypothetical protein